MNFTPTPSPRLGGRSGIGLCGNGFAADFYREVAAFVDADIRALVHRVLADEGHADFVVEKVRAAIAADPRVAGRLALWGRRGGGGVESGSAGGCRSGRPDPAPDRNRRSSWNGSRRNQPDVLKVGRKPHGADGEARPSSLRKPPPTEWSPQTTRRPMVVCDHFPKEATPTPLRSRRAARSPRRDRRRRSC